MAFITAVVVPAGPSHPSTLAVTEYNPAAANVVLVMEGFWTADVKLFGPVQLYEAPEILLAVRFKVCPSQIGLLLLAVGAAGSGLIVIVVEPEGPSQPSTVAITE